MELYQVTGRLHKLELVRMLAQRNEICKDGLYAGQMPVLNYLAEHPGCTQVEMADFLQVSPASIALSTKRLQKAGYLTKEVDEDNLRCKRCTFLRRARRCASSAGKRWTFSTGRRSRAFRRRSCARWCS